MVQEESLMWLLLAGCELMNEYVPPEQRVWFAVVETDDDNVAVSFFVVAASDGNAQRL
jgi:hypothetical protein